MKATIHYIITTLSVVVTKFTSGSVVNTTYGIHHGEITLKADVKGSIEEILWKWNSNKVIELVQNLKTEYGQFEGRIDVNVTTGDLTISDLTDYDNGKYTSEVQINGKLQYSTHELEVIDSVTPPQVHCEVSGSTLELLCSSDLSPLTSYSWQGPNDPGTVLGSELQLQSTESRDSVYTCVVKNPVSELREDFVVHHCFAGGGSIVINLVIALGVLCVILVILIGIWVYRKRCSKGHALVENDEDPEPNQEKSSLMKGNMNEQEDNSKESMLPHVVPPGQVKDEQMAQSSEDSKDRAEETRGTDNIEEPFSGGQESTKKSGEEEEDMANETSKGLSENSTDLPSKFFSDAEVSSRPQGAEQGTTEEEISQGEGKEEQPDS